MTAYYGDRIVSDDTDVMVGKLDELIVELRRIADVLDEWAKVRAYFAEPQDEEHKP